MSKTQKEINLTLIKLNLHKFYYFKSFSNNELFFKNILIFEVYYFYNIRIKSKISIIYSKNY